MKTIRKVLFGLAFLLAAGVMVYSGIQIASVLIDRQESSNANEKLQEQAVIQNREESSRIIINFNKNHEKADAPSDPAAETEPAAETVPVRVNFEYLHGINKDVAGWIYCEDTPISYPFLQSPDNNYYLYRLVDGTQNPSGSLFLDFRNQFDMSDWNSVIYGHNMHDGTMFASLNEYKKQEYYDAHPVMYLLTPEKQYKVELVAGILARADASFYDFPVPEDKQEAVVKGWLEASTFKTKTQIQPDDRFVTLSTCSYEFSDARYVVIGALREIE